MVTTEPDQKITYTTMGVEQAQAFNAAFEQAMSRVKTQLGREYPVYINGEARTVGKTFEDRSPNDTRQLLGTFQDAGQKEADAAIRAAQAAFKSWARRPWQERVDILRRAEANFRNRRFEIGAWLSSEVGKSRLESIGEVEEAADLIATYAGQMEENSGYVRKLNQQAPDEVNHSVMRPYGVWVVIAPFNFPVALATGMIAGALLAGNTVVFKPSHDAPLSGELVYRALHEAGLPDGVLNYVTGFGNELGEALSAHEGTEGIAFTGSREVGCTIYAQFSAQRPRPCITEMGGKNAVIVTDHADLDKAVEGTARAAFGYSGQKCSAASRVYVQEGIADEYLRRLVERTKEITVGNPEIEDVFMGPVINQRAYRRFQDATDEAGKSGRILVGGSTLTSGDLQHGYYCAPTITELPAEHRFFFEELFIPFLVVSKVRSMDEAIERANNSEYGLTAGIFSEDAEEIDRFLQDVEAGTIYVNRAGGATTGAWPGVQSFGGWKASASPGVSALGPYYVQQFMHEQNQTVVGR